MNKKLEKKILDREMICSADPNPQVVGFVEEILKEMHRAEVLHPNWPTDPVHAAAILSEEAGEVVKAVNNIVEKHLDDSDYRTEAIQCGAMCLRFLKNLEKFDWNIKL